jgi:lysophospholipase L1-like esterase
MGSRRLSRVVAATGAIFSLVVGLEGAARLNRRWTRSVPAIRPLDVDPSLPQITTFDQLTARYQRGTYMGVIHETNAVGFRSPERPFKKLAGTFRVVVLGDSFAMGAGVPAEDTYAALIEKRLELLQPGFVYEVVNSALSGLNSVQAIGRYEKLGLRYEPDLAIYGYTLNDIEGPSYVHSAVPTQDPYRLSTSPFELWRLVGPGAVALREAVWPPRGSYVYELRRNYFDNPAAWADLMSAFDKLATLDDSRHICTVIFIHSQLNSLNALHPFARMYEKVAQASRTHGFFPIQSFSNLRGRKDTELWVNAFDSHPNALAHRLFADSLLDGLAALPARCWLGATPMTP